MVPKLLTAGAAESSCLHTDILKLSVFHMFDIFLTLCRTRKIAEQATRGVPKLPHFLCKH